MRAEKWLDTYIGVFLNSHQLWTY